MLEEKVVEAEVVAEEAAPAAEAKAEVSSEDANKKALTAFILAVVAFCLCESAIVGIILSAIALKMLKGLPTITKAPHKVFVKVAKPVAIAALICSIVACVAYVILICVYGCIGATACLAALEGTESAIVLL